MKVRVPWPAVQQAGSGQGGRGGGGDSGLAQSGLLHHIYMHNTTTFHIIGLVRLYGRKPFSEAEYHQSDYMESRLGVD